MQMNLQRENVILVNWLLNFSKFKIRVFDETYVISNDSADFVVNH